MCLLTPPVGVFCSTSTTTPAVTLVVCHQYPWFCRRVSSSSAIAVSGVIVPCTREQRHETDGQGCSFMLDPFIRRNLNATDSRRSNRFALFKRKMRIRTSPSGFVPYFPSPSVIALPNVFRLLCRPECLESVTSLPSSSGRSWSA